MATYHPVLEISLLSSGGSTTDQYKAVFATSSASAGGYAVVGTRGKRATGVLQENSTEATRQRVMVLGVTKVAAGDSSSAPVAIAEGALVLASSKGQAVASTSTGDASGDWALGYALDALAAASTGIIRMMVFPFPLTSST